MSGNTPINGRDIVASSSADDLMAAYHSIQTGSYENLITLIEKDTSIVHATFADGSTLLHWAAQRIDGMRIVKLLVNHGADVNHSSGSVGEIPLMWAVRNQFLAPTVRYLLENGSHVNHRNVYGQDVLSVACQAGHPTIAFILYVPRRIFVI